MSATNKRMIWPSAEEMGLRVDQVPVGPPPPSGAVIKVRYAGVCKSDVSCWKYNFCPTANFPRVLGHEIAGYVFSLGANAKKGVSVGDAVMVYGPVGCGKCITCRAGESRVCEDRAPEVTRTYGINMDGGFQHYVSVDDVDDLIKVDKSIPLDVACLLPCGALTAFNALTTSKESIDRAMKITGQARLLVIGGGGLGLWGIKLARAMWPQNLQIAVADIAEDKLQLAKEASADVTILLDREKSVEDEGKKVKDACGGGIDGSLDFVNSKQTVGVTLQAINVNCTLVLVGITLEEVMYPFPLMNMPFKSISLRGVFMGNRQQLRDVQDLVVKSGISPTRFIYNLEEVPAIFDRLVANTQQGRAVIDMEK